MKVRAAGEGDREALLALRCALWPQRELAHHDHEIGLRARSRARHETLLVEDANGQVCGFADLSRDQPDPGQPGRVTLQALFVSPPSRRQGAARRLLDAAERWAHGRGAAELVCDLDAADARAREALGWLGFGSAVERVRISRAVKAPLEVARQPAPVEAPSPAGDAVFVVEPARSRVMLFVNVALFAAALVSFAYTDIFSSDSMRGVLLPLLDVVLVVYFLFLFMMLRYRKRADSSARADRLFRGGG